MSAQTIGRRELLRGGGVAALAVGAAAVVPLVAKAATDDPLLDVLNRFKAEEAAFDAYNASLDKQRKNGEGDRRPHSPVQGHPSRSRPTPGRRRVVACRSRLGGGRNKQHL
jgi:hypothetical protein